MDVSLTDTYFQVRCRRRIKSDIFHPEVFVEYNG